MSVAWQCFFDELRLWRDEGRQVEFWWRDDDATLPNAALARLTALSRDTGVPLALAVIPEGAHASLMGAHDPCVTVLQHGVAHRNRAGAEEKKTEFPAAEPIDSMVQHLLQGRRHLEALFGARSLPVLVPPWNRISSQWLVPRLASAGFAGLSTFTPRRALVPAAGLVQVNTHVDIIDWHGSRGFVGDDVALGQALRHLQLKRSAQVDSTEPTGWLTHHADHDEAAWYFMQSLLEKTAGVGHLHWRGAPELFVVPAVPVLPGAA